MIKVIALHIIFDVEAICAEEAETDYRHIVPTQAAVNAGGTSHSSLQSLPAPRPDCQWAPCTKCTFVPAPWLDI